jgi:DNA polymerase I-like protein with 3'-5' exonuclease and polymerase domains
LPTILTHELTPETALDSNTNLQTYCGLDSMITLEVWQKLQTQFNQPPSIYQFERALQGPYLEIMQRGFLTDRSAAAVVIRDLEAKEARLEHVLNELATAVWGRGLNPRSPKQMNDFFYRAMQLPEQWISQKGIKRLSTNREALEKLEVYMHPRPLIACVLALRDIGKQKNVLQTEIDEDSRWRTSYNIAGTETGRPSSSENAFGTGSNTQNIAPNLRFMFVADAGKILCVIDLEQVEARDVGFFIGCLFDDWTFLDNCESGDLHTNNAKLVWPNLAWTGDKKRDREIADQQFYREFSYRDMAKRGGHLSNYYGTAWTMARSLKIPLAVAEEFQARYCRGSQSIQPAFPGIARWWTWTAQQLQTTSKLTTPFGRMRHFFGRPNDDTTLREAIAFLPQSTTADRMNLGLWRVWRHMPQVELLAQTYDSITFQFDERLDRDAIISEALDRIRVELVAPSGRKYVVPGEAKIGYNWGSRVVQSDVDRAVARNQRPPRLNPEGLVKWKPGLVLPPRRVGLQRIAHA